MASITVLPEAKPDRYWLVKRLVGMAAILLAMVAVIANVKLVLDGHMQSLGTLAYYTLLLVMFTIRKQSVTEVTKPLHWFMALAGTWLPFCVITSAHPNPTLSAVAIPLQIAGIVGTLVALGSLWRSFGIFAACREVKTGGLYRVMRHPLYAMELLALIGVVVMFFSCVNLLILAAEVFCQCWRIRDEESLLGQTEEYRAYMGRVKYRLLPFVF